MKRATCSGGGAFALGFELALLVGLHRRGIYFDRIDGVSGGSLAALLFASMEPSEAVQTLRKIKKTKQIYKNPSWIRLALSFIWPGLRNGFYSYEPMREFLMDELKGRELNTELGVGVFDLSEGKPVHRDFPKGMDATTAVDSVVQAMSICGLVHLNDHRHCDLGPIDSIVHRPIETELKAGKKWTDVFILSIHHFKPLKTSMEILKTKGLKGMIGMLFATSTNETFANDHKSLTRVCGRYNVNLVTFIPTKEYDVYEFDEKNITGSYDHGLEVLKLWQ